MEINFRKQWNVNVFKKISASLNWENKQLIFSAHSQLITSISLDMMRLRRKSSPLASNSTYTHIICEWVVYLEYTFTSYYNHNHNKIEHISREFFSSTLPNENESALMKYYYYSSFISHSLSISSEQNVNGKSFKNTSLQYKVRWI